MRSRDGPDVPVTLLIQRLMDADLVQPEDGLALLRGMREVGQPEDKDGDGTPETSANRRLFLITLEDGWIKSTGATLRPFGPHWIEFGPHEQSPGNRAANAAEIGEPRDSALLESHERIVKE